MEATLGKKMNLLKLPLLAITILLALASASAQASFVCTATTCAYADRVIDPQALGSPAETEYVSAIVFSTDPDPDAAYDAVLGAPVDKDDGVRLAPVAPVGASLNSIPSPNNNSMLTLHMESTVTDYLLVYSLDTSGLEMRFELFVSEFGNNYEQLDYSGDDDSDRPFFENNEGPIYIGNRLVNFVQFRSLGGDTLCAAGYGAYGCKDYAHTMQINGVAGILASAVPVPAAVWLFGSGLIGLLAVGRRRRQT